MNLRPHDILNADRRSGYSGVSYAPNGGNGREQKKPYHAQKRVGKGNGPGSRWAGPRRTTAEEAAQDFCEFVNGGGVAVAPKLKSAGHKTRTPRNPDDLSEAEKLARYYTNLAREEARDPDAPAYVYLITEIKVWETAFVKIGWAKDPDLRVGGLQHGNPRVLGVLGTIETTVGEAEELERSLHAKYIGQNILGEWFRPTPELLKEFDL